MSGLITRKPFVGFATGIIFGALGLLLINIDEADFSPRALVLWMFRIVGGFMIFVAIGSLITAAYSIISADKAGRSK